MSDDLVKDTAALLQQILEQSERTRHESSAGPKTISSLSPCFDLIDELVSKLCKASNRRYVLVMADEDDGTDAQMLCVSGDEDGNPNRRESIIELLHGALECMQIDHEQADDIEQNDLN